MLDEGKGGGGEAGRTSGTSYPPPRLPPSRLGRLAAAIRRIAGMPDYERYVQHLRACHPDRPIPDRADFFLDFVEQRYRGGGGRCC
jgi:uncharacterized short protein YbdD (DUF466 family)